MIAVTSDITLHPITQADQPALMRLMQRIYPPAYGHYWKDDCSWYLAQQYGPENLVKELHQKDSHYFFVSFRKSIIGIFKYIVPCLYPPLEEENALKVHRIYLDTKVQGKGIGKKLMHYAEDVACANNNTLIWLDAMETQQQAQAFYTRLGYSKTALQRLDFKLLYDEHRPMWFMHKML